MAVIKTNYGAAGTAITCTFTSLANSAFRSSLAIDNTTNLFMDAQVAVKIKTNAAGTSATGFVTVYVYASFDGGTTYGSGETGVGTDATVTLTIPTDYTVLGVIPVTGNAQTLVGYFTVAQLFGGILPNKWGIIVANSTGAALDASVGSAWYQGIQSQVV